MNKKFSLNSVELQEYQPNRYPFLMIDYVDEVSPGKYARGYKNMTMNEWFFPVHFPAGPNMPGALQLERRSNRGNKPEREASRKVRGDEIFGSGVGRRH